jgi:hypothetical protein
MEGVRLQSANNLLLSLLCAQGEHDDCLGSRCSCECHDAEARPVEDRVDSLFD